MPCHLPFSCHTNMAADQDKCNNNIQLLKKTHISVFVDEALPDILVVTYEHGVQIFKGVLLDSTKRNLPCGVPTLNPVFKKPKPEDDVLYSVSQRFAYTDPSTSKKKNVQIPSKYKNNKMTVRLRPRQVLCSKCKGICNENSENVSRKRKTPDTVQHPNPPVKRGLNAPITRSVYSELASKKQLLSEGSLIPKLTRLTPQEEQCALTGGTIHEIMNINKTTKGLSNKENTQEKHHHHHHHHHHHSSDHSGDEDDDDDSSDEKDRSRSSRKKRSLGSMEDLWDESVFEENKSEKPLGGVTINTRTIKISYGPQGEGTVLKIPAAQIPETAAASSASKDVAMENSEENDNNSSDNRAARKALKRAKKEARRKVFLGASGSPCYLGNVSPARYTIGSSSPRYTVGSASPRHGLGNNSPRYAICSTYEVPRRRKHKMKHKKKHKEDKDRKHKEGEVSSSTQEEPKEVSVTQKLSINLKRLNNTYTPYPPPAFSTTEGKERVAMEENNTSSSDEHSEQIPNFPPPNPPLMLRINSQTMTSAPRSDGSRVMVGDVVWGKVQGFPWWPGKVLAITNCGGQGPQAHVSWYGSTTSSLISFDQLSPYLENFKVRYNKKKRGPYKEAIKQATHEAKENAEGKTRQPLSTSPSQHNILPQVVPPALASPREIDVAS